MQYSKAHHNVIFRDEALARAEKFWLYIETSRL